METKNILEYAEQAGYESGAQVKWIGTLLTISVDGVSGEAQAIRLVKDLANCGAKITKDGETLTAHVTIEIAGRLLNLVKSHGTSSEVENAQTKIPSQSQR